MSDYMRLFDKNAKLREERDHYKALWEHATVTDCELRRVRAAWKEDREQNAKLRDRITHLEADRRELEKRLASLESTHEVLADFDGDLEQECADFIVENRKLRELVRDMHAVISDRNSWWDCMCKDTRRFADRMRELGVEVE